MIVVMENGYATGGSFEDVVLKDLIPEIDRAYRTQPDRARRAIAGLSMGGGQAMNIGLGNPSLFALVGSFSGAGLRGAELKTLYRGAFADTKAFNGSPQDFVRSDILRGFPGFLKSDVFGVGHSHALRLQ
jgi:enterochelin esterase family protein